MTRALVGVSGPTDGTIFLLDKPDVTVGRARGSDIRLTDLSVSYRHCVLRTFADRIKVHDLGSRNGTFVNGLRVREQALSDGDQLIVGQVIFICRTLRTGGVSELPLRQIDPSSKDTMVEPGVPLAREAAALVLTRDIVQSVQAAYLARSSTSGRTEIPEQPFENIVRLIPSRRGVIGIISGTGDMDVLARYRTDPNLEEASVPAGVLDQILQRREAMTGFETTTPWIASPVEASGAVKGVLYLDCCGTGRHYTGDDLNMITALSELLGLALENAQDIEALREENARLNQKAGFDTGLIGRSSVMKTVDDMIARFARGNATVLIRGESGTGKELVARAIHGKSPRSAKPFVAINCAAIADTLLESEMFGSEKGAFTGAFALRKGRIEAANGGTLFLDEVGELAPALQAKLLRVLQEHEFERVGGIKTIPVDIRVIAATNRNLENAIREGTFREDLFYRLNVLPLTMPALRERREDIPLLAEAFLKKAGSQAARSVRGISREAHACLMAYDWPGNVRELQNVLERAVVLGSGDKIAPDDLPPELHDFGPAGESASDGFHGQMRELRRRVIAAALDRSRGNVAEAARNLKLHPVYLHRLITNLRLRDRDADEVREVKRLGMNPGNEGG